MCYKIPFLKNAQKCQINVHSIRFFQVFDSLVIPPLKMGIFLTAITHHKAQVKI